MAAALWCTYHSSGADPRRRSRRSLNRGRVAPEELCFSALAVRHSLARNSRYPARLSERASMSLQFVRMGECVAENEPTNRHWHRVQPATEIRRNLRAFRPTTA
jgi:hypothetical protein